MDYVPDSLSGDDIPYHGRAGSNVIPATRLMEKNILLRELHLEEVLPGMYVCHMNFFQKDHVKYRLESDGSPVDEGAGLEFETFEYGDGEERVVFFTLNHLDSEESCRR